MLHYSVMLASSERLTLRALGLIPRLEARL
jgi:hypothetical protein